MLVVLLSFAAVVLAVRVAPAPALGGQELLALSADDWTLVQQADGTQAYACTLPQALPENAVVSLRMTSAAFTLLLEGEPIYHFVPDARLNAGFPLLLTLPAGAEGKVLTLAAPAAAAAYCVAQPAWVGAPAAVYRLFLQQNLPALLFSCAALLLGVILLVLQAAAKKDFASKDFNFASHINALAFFIMAAGLWILTDSPILMLYTAHAAVIALVSYLSFFSMPLFLVLFVQSLLPPRITAPLLCGHSCILLAYLALYLANASTLLIVPLLCSHVLTLLTLGILIYACVHHWRKADSLALKLMLLGFCLLAGFTILALFVFYLNTRAGYAVWYCVGIVCFVTLLGLASLREFTVYWVKSVEFSTYRRLATTDLMTHLKNRTAFIQAQEAREHGKREIYLLIDINSLKDINDTYGHLEGDRVIVEVADCITRVFGTLGHCYRIGGDEFAVIMDAAQQAGLASLCARFEREVAARSGAGPFPFSTALGYAVQQDPATPPGTLYKTADEQMYTRKQEMKAQG